MELPFDSFASELFAAFGVAFSEFIGVPLPGGLLLVGIAAAGGPVSTPLLILVAAAGAMLADLVWYSIGRSRGEDLLALYCRLTGGSGRCVSDSRSGVECHGVAVLLFCKFVPGLSIFAVPTAGLARIPLGRFVRYNLGGVLIWASVYVGLGTRFGVGVVSTLEENFGSALTPALVALVTVALLLALGRFLRRRRFGDAEVEALVADLP